MYKIQADTHEDAVLALVQQIDNIEGRDGVLDNNGFPSHCLTGSSQNFYLAMHCMAAYVCNVGMRSLTISLKQKAGGLREHMISIYYIKMSFIEVEGLKTAKLSW